MSFLENIIRCREDNDANMGCEYMQGNDGFIQQMLYL